MEKIVVKPIIADLHIHSVASKFKDGNVVKDSTINNIGVLINKLNENNVGMVAITDHDVFDYDIYKRLKQEENVKSIKKVFPGVEFSVKFKRKKIPLHVIAIFNDENDAKVKNIANVLSVKKSSDKPNYDANNAFTEKRFLEILSKIDLDTILIVHQKRTTSSESKPQKHDALSLGRKKFNDFILTEYFEAFEFKNMKNELFNNLEKQHYPNNAIRFITGSDCHEWSAYPKHDAALNETAFNFTYLKCLPTFRGLSFAITDDTRIGFNAALFTTAKENYIEDIALKIDGKEYKIPLSGGINAIIGDNSIGKSLLLHKLTNYYRATQNSSLSAINSRILPKYEKYLNDNNIEICSSIPIEKIFEFDTQGEIRRKFDQGGLKDVDFFKDKYPNDIDVLPQKSAIESYVNDCISVIKDKFDYDNLVADIKSVVLPSHHAKPSSINFIKCDLTRFIDEDNKFSNILKFYDDLNATLSNFKVEELPKTENNKINSFKDFVVDRINFYQNAKKSINLKMNLINCINNASDSFRNEITKTITDYGKEYNRYTDSKNNMCESIFKAIQKKHNFTFPKSNLGYEIQPNTRPYKNYNFVKKTKISIVDDDYIILLVNSPFKKGNNILSVDINTLSREQFTDMLFRYDEDKNALDFYRDKIMSRINEDFAILSTITDSKDDSSREYSDGVNSKFYFDIISSDRYKNGIYLIDQPEDDISQKSINNYLIDEFKSMSQYRQIILVTHNPQFVVNLDVDNVIFLSKTDNNKLHIQSGALEYKDDKTDIIKIVAETLEGGVESIRQRWKRYEKNNTGIYKR